MENMQSLDETSSKILEKFFGFDRNISKEEVSSQLGVEMSMISYHFDVLKECDFIRQATVARSGSSWVQNRRAPGKPATFRITPDGRKYVVEVLRT